MRARGIALLGALLLVAACGPSGAVARPFGPGASVHTINVGGVDRGYRLYIPAGLPPAASLVVMLHGWTGSATQAERVYGWNQLADSAKFVVAYPEGVGGSWNAGAGGSPTSDQAGCCGRASRDGVDDVGFVTAAVREIVANVGIDPARIYAAGISNGGMLAYKLACDSAVFAAIGPDSATQLDACPAPHPTSVLHIHGTGDRLIRYDGEPGTAVPIKTPPPPDLNAFWRTVDQCQPPETTVDGGLTTSVADCPSGRSVELITVAGGGHEWPSFATQRMWDFFAAHPG
ncbi:polyhydroxybutyrate depolymerase [Mycolicibacterium sp. CH28]|uniref:alpha/beta hydrolase family esterase n=1 Tax=Mycolicibacterium sp. CH28 TaxID=2512237 RepID=UPI0010822FBA|nr:PHB depolymerase family esterase [Mycolicibacterium sp. CH28]TGD85356.1 polyhydroxybutyrate depolymerase [Mycolicibacterium sp. CH28]